MGRYELNPKQARQFAYVIYKDIAEYIANHQEEYEEFLKNEEQHTQGGR